MKQLVSQNVGSSFRLYYYKARVYHPELGRFMQTDPIGYEDGMNWYAYVGNDPVNMSDPTGLSGCSDMSDQGLSGKCIESSEFDESKHMTVGEYLSFF